MDKLMQNVKIHRNSFSAYRVNNRFRPNSNFEHRGTEDVTSCKHFYVISTTLKTPAITLHQILHAKPILNRGLKCSKNTLPKGTTKISGIRTIKPLDKQGFKCKNFPFMKSFSLFLPRLDVSMDLEGGAPPAPARSMDGGTMWANLHRIAYIITVILNGQNNVQTD
uniref:Uncharacterized protein n=1 Tax=Romanomermis culicivorax TaxID=13658 RepID=A0A915HSL6_ROMCU